MACFVDDGNAASAMGQELGQLQTHKITADDHDSVAQRQPGFGRLPYNARLAAQAGQCACFRGEPRRQAYLFAQ